MKQYKKLKYIYNFNTNPAPSETPISIIVLNEAVGGIANLNTFNSIAIEMSSIVNIDKCLPGVASR